MPASRLMTLTMSCLFVLRNLDRGSRFEFSQRNAAPNLCATTLSLPHKSPNFSIPYQQTNNESISKGVQFATGENEGAMRSPKSHRKEKPKMSLTALTSVMMRARSIAKLRKEQFAKLSKLAERARESNVFAEPAMPSYLEHDLKDERKYTGHKAIVDFLKMARDTKWVSGGRTRPASPRGDYIRSCLSDRRTIEPLRVVRRSKTHKLDLAHFGIGGDLAKHLRVALSLMPFAETIDASANRLTDVGGRALLDDLPEWVTRLDLSQNR